VVTPRDDLGVLPSFGSWNEYWAVRHDAALWEPFFVKALRSAELSSSEIVMLRPSQYPTARAGDAIVTIYPGTLISGSSCAMELEAHSLVAGRGLPIPKLIAHGVFPQQAGQSSWSWLIESAATGSPWSRSLDALTDEQKKRASADLGATLRRLHETPHEAATVLASEWERFSDLVADELNHLGTNDARLAAFPTSFQPALRDLAAATLGALDTSAPTKLLHGDVHGDNVFVDPSAGEVTGLIDLNEMYAGHPWYDLADASFRLLHGAPGLIDSLLDGYGLDPSTHDQAAVQLLGWALLHDFDGLTATIQHRGLPAGDTIEELAAHLTGFDLESGSPP